MRKPIITVAALAAFGLVGCTQNHRDEPAARQLGREAHHAAEDIKHGAKEAAHEAREAGKNFREGWNEARHDPPRRDNDRRRQ